MDQDLAATEPSAAIDQQPSNLPCPVIEQKIGEFPYRTVHGLKGCSIERGSQPLHDHPIPKAMARCSALRTSWFVIQEVKRSRQARTILMPLANLHGAA